MIPVVDRLQILGLLQDSYALELNSGLEFMNPNRIKLQEKVGMHSIPPFHLPMCQCGWMPTWNASTTCFFESIFSS